MYLGPHVAITSLWQHVLRILLCQSSAHSREQHYDFKALEFGKQRHCLLLQRQGVGLFHIAARVSSLCCTNCPEGQQSAGGCLSGKPSEVEQGAVLSF